MGGAEWVQGRDEMSSVDVVETSFPAGFAEPDREANLEEGAWVEDLPAGVNADATDRAGAAAVAVVAVGMEEILPGMLRWRVRGGSVATAALAEKISPKLS